MEKTRDAMVYKGIETKTQKGDGLQNALQAGTNIDNIDVLTKWQRNSARIFRFSRKESKILQSYFENKLNILDEIRNTSLYLCEQFLSGDDIIVKYYEEMSSQFLLTIPNHGFNSTAKIDAILGMYCYFFLKTCK